MPHCFRVFTLLEVMVAVAICAILLLGLGASMTGASQANMYREDRVIAFKAAHQQMELMLSLDLDTMLLQNGNTFTVGSTENPTNTAGAVGTITITDLNWDGLPGKAYKVELAVDEFNVKLTTVRTRY